MRKLMKFSVLFVVVMALAAAACGGDHYDSASSTTVAAATTTVAKATGGITVSAAASLTEAFTKIGTDFKTANPDATVTFNFGSSGTLATQIQQGAPADTFASADEDNMNKLVTANLVDGRPIVFATNKLTIVTKPGNPKDVKTLADLAALPTVSLCGETVPCGKYAAQILQGAGVTIPETSVTVEIPDAQNAIATYPIATLTASTNKATSQAFIDYVMSSKGQATLSSFGFLPPS